MQVTVPIDERDAAILGTRQRLMDELEGPREGDYVRFADGELRRISFVSPRTWLPEVDCVQTSKGGSWYLGNYGCSFSGSLYPPVTRETLALTSETLEGSAWFFHHDHHQAHNGVEVRATFRVYECSVAAPQ